MLFGSRSAICALKLQFGPISGLAIRVTVNTVNYQLRLSRSYFLLALPLCTV
jgi:hypothetical protein